MEVKDMLGLGKILPIEKLITVVTRATGRLTQHYFDRKDADSEAYRIRKLAEARADEIGIIGGAMRDQFQALGKAEYKEGKIIISQDDSRSLDEATALQKRTTDRFEFQQLNKQLNLERIISHSVDAIRNEGSVASEEVDKDWSNRFFRIAEDISSEQMQALWGKILSDEVTRPGSYSLRTLDILRNLSRQEAELFARVAQFAISNNERYYLFKGQNEAHLEKLFQISFDDTAKLKELGLLHTADFLAVVFERKSSDHQDILVAGDRAVVIELIGTGEFSMAAEAFTTAGQELIKLVKPNPPMAYLRYLVDPIKSANLSFKYADILELKGPRTSLSELMDF